MCVGSASKRLPGSASQVGVNSVAWRDFKRMGRWLSRTSATNVGDSSKKVSRRTWIVLSVRCKTTGTAGPVTSSIRPSPYVPVAAFKGLTRMAIACLPRRELAAFEDAIEWVGNLDHELDMPSFGPLTCQVQFFSEPFPAPWAVLALKGDDVHMPHALFHLGQRALTDADRYPSLQLRRRSRWPTAEDPPGTPAILDGREVAPIGVCTVSLASSRATRETRVRWF